MTESEIPEQVYLDAYDAWLRVGFPDPTEYATYVAPNSAQIAASSPGFCAAVESAYRTAQQVVAEEIAAEIEAFAAPTKPAHYNAALGRAAAIARRHAALKEGIET